MIVYRQKKIPAIYCDIPFLRVKNGAFVDCPEDYEDRIIIFQEMMKHKICVSKREAPHEITYAISLPDKILDLKGETDKRICYKKYAWNIWDVIYYMNQNQPAEAINPLKENLDIDIMYKLSWFKSCIPLIRQLEMGENRHKGYYMSADEEKILKRLEQNFWQELKVKKLKGSFTSSVFLHNKNQKYKSITPKLREQILRRDNYKCVFCGATSSTEQLEVHHIIPRNIISKLHFTSSLVTARYNLVTTCFKCNRGKSDNLSIEDVKFLQERFSDPQHPNYKISELLKRIQELQNL